MTDLCIQIHPHRSAGLDLPGIRAECEALARDEKLVRRFSISEGVDGHAYANLMFETDDLKSLWVVLWRRLYGSDEHGYAMRRASMAMCEGRRGWDDYLQLYHFDPEVPRDRLSD